MAFEDREVNFPVTKLGLASICLLDTDEFFGMIISSIVYSLVTALLSIGDGRNPKIQLGSSNAGSLLTFGTLSYFFSPKERISLLDSSRPAE